MRLQNALLLSSLLLACATSRTTVPVTPVSTRVVAPLVLPTETPAADVTLRMFVIGDAGADSPQRAAVFKAMRTMLDWSGQPAALLAPGDLVYQVGLPADCKAAEERLQTLYFRDTPPQVPIYAVAGNHDHENKDFGAKPEVALRAAYFDCAQQGAAATRVNWPPDACTCNAQWHYPSGVGNVGSVSLLPTTATQKGITLITFDSQVAIETPEVVAAELERTIDAAPQRVIVMAHHPLQSVGPHGRITHSAQDLGNAKYAGYIERFRRIFFDRRDKIALTVFGHDHSVQYRPSPPPQLISGVGSKMSGVGPTNKDAFAVGDSPGLAVLELHANGAVTVRLISTEVPVSFEIEAK